jgi:hypothetical protein
MLLLTEAQLADGTLYDPEGDISTEEALKILRKELPGGQEKAQ